MVTDPDVPVYKSDLKMIERAMRKRWPTRSEVKTALLAKIARIGLSTEDTRVLLGATRCYLQAEAQNQADELKGLPDKVVITNETAPVDANGQRTAILRAIAAEREKRVARRGGQ